jgi:DNA-directed RNA polymerase specialized sigma subunit
MYRELSYDELDIIVQDFQRGYDGCADLLVDAYDGFITKYVNLLERGVIFPDNERMRNFIGLYITKPNVKNHLSEYIYMPSIKTAIYSTAQMLSEIFADYKRQELYNELVSVLLDMAKRYRKDISPMFHIYIDRMFNFMLKKHLSTMSKDPLVRDEWVSYDDECEDTENGNVVETDLVFERIHESIEIGKADIPVISGSGLNLNWINGVTATSVFKTLSPLDRQILVLYYIDGMDDSEIAKVLGYGARETINRRRNKAKVVITRYVENSNMFRLRQGDNLQQETPQKVRRVQGKVPVQAQQDTEHEVKTRVYCAGLVGQTVS